MKKWLIILDSDAVSADPQVALVMIIPVWSSLPGFLINGDGIVES